MLKKEGKKASALQALHGVMCVGAAVRRAKWCLLDFSISSAVDCSWTRLAQYT